MLCETLSIRLGRNLGCLLMAAAAMVLVPFVAGGCNNTPPVPVMGGGDATPDNGQGQPGATLPDDGGGTGPVDGGDNGDGGTVVVGGDTGGGDVSDPVGGDTGGDVGGGIPPNNGDTGGGDTGGDVGGGDTGGGGTGGGDTGGGGNGGGDTGGGTNDPVCGNGTVETGEECDPPDGVTCDANCATIADLAVPNDDCSAPIAVTEGTISFSNVDATTDGPDEPELCKIPGFDDSQVNSDIWYCYVATCDDIATFSLCGSSYDTKMAVYANGTDTCGCPNGDILRCNDDGCGAGLIDSRITLSVTQGLAYMIRVGGFETNQGDGMLTITCGQAEVCGPDAGDCLSANGTPGCSDAACCNNICDNIDRFCCDVEWDARCAENAKGICAGSFTACPDGVGACAQPQAQGGCEDTDCCQRVCEIDTFCCIDQWDDICVDEAAELCGGGTNDACMTSTESCTAAHRGPGCSDEACCLDVCATNPECCTVEWTDACVQAAGGCRR